MNQFYLNVNELQDKLEVIEKEILNIQQEIKRLDSWGSLPVNQVLLGDCLELMKALPDNCVDCVVTDPPYSLGKIKSISALLQAWLNGEDGYEHHSNGFMSQHWDVMPSPNVWREVLRVLKPGGYALVFAGTRTYDLMGMSLRLAGFEISESISWTFGQGFPKSKKMLKPAHEPILFCYKPGKTEDLNIDDCRLNIATNEPNARKAKTIKEKIYNKEIFGQITKKGEGWNGSEGRYPANFLLSHSPDCVACGTKEIKSLSGSPILNSKRKDVTHLKGLNPTIQYGHHASDGTEEIAAYQCVESCPIRLLDEQTAEMRASKPSGIRPDYVYPVNTLGQFTTINKEGRKMNAPQDSDSTANASRFFLNLEPEAPFIYQPKASRNDRTIGGKVENNHITVKPVNLMSYLVRLICPADGIVLDPFIGSGSTALGCLREDRCYIGMEKNEEYHKIALERIQAYQ
jgi:site-specific DNA-methyltransferase (adenine-specific)